MHASPPPVRAQTIKQAKAAYKARGQPTISEAERRQLERAAELDRRAWRVKEAEKKKAEAAKKRTDKEREERESARLATQVKCDKFGYKSSQMHLGAFWKRPTPVEAVEQKENLEMSVQGLSEDEDFGDSDMDDETLFEALDGTSDVGMIDEDVQPAPAGPVGAHISAILSDTPPTEAAVLHTSTMDNFASFFDDFESSTQITRELNADEPMRPVADPQPVPTHLAVDAGEYDDFDLTVEDLEELNTLSPKGSNAQDDRKLMPPPSLPLKRVAPSTTFESGFTTSELEQFVEDDLQLTQCDSG